MAVRIFSLEVDTKASRARSAAQLRQQPPPRLAPQITATKGRWIRSDSEGRVQPQIYRAKEAGIKHVSRLARSSTYAGRLLIELPSSAAQEPASALPLRHRRQIRPPARPAGTVSHSVFDFAQVLTTPPPWAGSPSLLSPDRQPRAAGGDLPLPVPVPGYRRPPSAPPRRRTGPTSHGPLPAPASSPCAADPRAATSTSTGSSYSALSHHLAAESARLAQLVDETRLQP
jgi:hypothetical protein